MAPLDCKFLLSSLPPSGPQGCALRITRRIHAQACLWRSGRDGCRCPAHERLRWRRRGCLPLGLEHGICLGDHLRGPHPHRYRGPRPRRGGRPRDLGRRRPRADHHEVRRGVRQGERRQGRRPDLRRHPRAVQGRHQGRQGPGRHRRRPRLARRAGPERHRLDPALGRRGRQVLRTPLPPPSSTARATASPTPWRTSA